MIVDHNGFRFYEEKAAIPATPAALLLFGHPVDPTLVSATRLSSNQIRLIVNLLVHTHTPEAITARRALG